MILYCEKNMSLYVVSFYAFGIFEVMFSCSFAINGCILWFYCVQYLSLHHGSDMKSFIRLRNIALSFIGLCSIAGSCIGIANIIRVAIYPVTYNGISITLWSVAVFLFSIVIPLHAFFFITRLHYTFNETVYKISDKTRITMRVITTILLILFLFTGALMVLEVLQYIPFGLSSQTGHTLQHVQFILWIILGLQQFCIANMFSSKLFVITVQIGHTKYSHSAVAMNSKSGASVYTSGSESLSLSVSKALNQKQNKLLTLIAKQTLLSRIESTALIILVVLRISSLVTSNQAIIITTDAFGYVYLICVSITMQLSFVFADKCYHRCCVKCHQCYVNKYKKKAIKHYKNKIKLLKKQKYSGKNIVPIMIAKESDHYNYVQTNIN